MSYLYGILKHDSGTNKELFPVSIDVFGPTNENSETQGNWPRHVVVFKNADTKETVAQIYLAAPLNMTVDESNVVDLMEYICSNFKINNTDINDSPYDQRYEMYDSGNPQTSFKLTMRRATGCRYFVVHQWRTTPLHFTAPPSGIINKTRRHDVSDLLIVRNKTTKDITHWQAGVNDTGFEISFHNASGGEPDKFNIPYAHAPTPKEIAKRQLLSTKSYYGDPDNFAGHPGSYDPKRLIKVAHPSGFWYLKANSDQLIITLIKDAWMSAMTAVFREFRSMDADDRRRLELVYSEWLAMSLNYDGKEREKSIISNSIQMLEKISQLREELADSK